MIWLFRIGQMLGLPSLLFKSMSLWKIHIIVGILSFIAGIIICNKVDNYFEDVEKAQLIKKIRETEQIALDLEKERDKLYTDRLKEVYRYAKTRDNIECLNTADLELFNKRD